MARRPITNFVSEVTIGTCTSHATPVEDLCLIDAYSLDLFLFLPSLTIFLSLRFIFQFFLSF
jgi:hypothetical protein